MFLYPALTIGFLFVAVPPLVHLINMLRHRRQTWAAMDFLLASYRKQKKWIVLRQLLLLLARLAVAALLIAMLCGWNGGRQLLSSLGGQTSHHVVVLDDSYSMGDASGGSSAYARSLLALQDLTRRLASDDGNHQLTVMRSSRAAMAIRGGSDSGDSAADLSAQTITTDARLINRVMATRASSVQADLVSALDLATELISSTPADTKYLYIASDFRERDWASPERYTESLRALAGDDVKVRMIDCADVPQPNLGITNVSLNEDVWVAGVPVVVNVTVRNYGRTQAKNVALSSRVILYGDDIERADPTRQFSGTVDPLPSMIIETLGAGEETTKTFQVFVSQTGTHAIEVSLPEDALAIDNVRTCTLPLSDAEKVLIVDSNPDGLGAYHIASVLDPGSQVRIGAIPEVQPPSFLRSATIETLSAYRAIYLVDLQEIGDNAASVLSQYVQRGGGLAWFLGNNVSRDSYNTTLLGNDRYLLPAPLDQSVPLPRDPEETTGDVVFGDTTPLLAPLQRAGDAAISLIGVSRSWDLQSLSLGETAAPDAPRVYTVLKRRDGKPLVTKHNVGNGRVVTVLTGLDGSWTNWPGDPTFVVFLLQTNATLWGGAAPPTARFVDDPMSRTISALDYTPDVSYLPAATEPPRVAIDLVAKPSEEGGESFAEESVLFVGFDPAEMVIEGEANVDEVLVPGVSEWTLTRSDGRNEVVPLASVIRSGEGDLARADQPAIAQAMLPLEVKFISSSAWSQENQTAGSSTVTMFLLALLGIILAGEQLLAYWASYHVAPSKGAKS